MIQPLNFIIFAFIIYIQTDNEQAQEIQNSIGWGSECWQNINYFSIRP